MRPPKNNCCPCEDDLVSFHAGQYGLRRKLFHHRLEQLWANLSKPWDMEVKRAIRSDAQKDPTSGATDAFRCASPEAVASSLPHPEETPRITGEIRHAEGDLSLGHAVRGPNRLPTLEILRGLNLIGRSCDSLESQTQ